MATLLDVPRSPGPAKIEEYVEKQIDAARRRVRVLDFFMAGLTLALGSLAFFLVALLVDRYVETPRGTGWAVLAGYLGLAAGFIYLALFRPSRRQINPYFAARQVEQSVPNAKNSLVTWVDFEEDSQLPGSIRTAIGQKAARDLKGVDLNRAIEDRKILWLGIAVAVLALGNLVVAFLPPTRTELTIEEPSKGDTTVFNNQEVPFRVRVDGRIPGANDADHVRLRLWYNPDDPDSYEERAMKPAEDDRRRFGVIVPAKQVRNGFRYQILAGNTQTREYTVTCKIIPEFTGFEVNYEYPAYLKRAAESTNDPNLLAPFGTTATLTASTNREVKHGHIEIEGQARTIDGRLIDGRSDAIQFTVPIEKEGHFRIWFTTPEGDKNQDPARLRLGVIDPKPVFRSFDVDYEYPAYLRFKPMSAKDLREPQIEAPRGSKVILTAKTSRGVQGATLEVDGQTIVGEKVANEPMWVRFKLPPLDKEGTARATFTPSTPEGPSTPRPIPIRALTDQAPTVQINSPEEEEKQLPANGTLELKGLATDDHGVDKITLRMKVIGAEDRDIKAKPYRAGMSFFRKDDSSWPTRVEYKDFVRLPDLRLEKDPIWRAAAGAVIEYWLEAVDNCAIEPGPNRNVSKPKRIRLIAPAMTPDEQKRINDQNRMAEQDQKAHDKRQDAANAAEKRDAQQPPPPGAEQPKNPPEPKKGEPGDAGQPNMGGMNDTPPPGMEDPDHKAKTEQVNQAIKKSEDDRKIADTKPDTRPTPDAKVDPGEGRPEPRMGPMGTPPAEDHKPKTDPNMDMMGDGAAGSARGGEVDKTKEDKGNMKPQGEPMPGMGADKGDAKPSFGGASDAAGADKPEPKDAMPPMPGMSPPQPVDKATARKEQPKDPKSGERTQAGTTKPDKEVTAADKKPGGEPGPMGDMPPQDAGGTKPRETPAAGGTKPEPKKDEVADAGGARGKPMDPDAAGGARPDKQPMGGMDEEARGGSKAGPQPPQDGSQKPGELNRELGELAREINSPNPEVSDEAKDDVDRLMRNPQTREQTRKELDKLERNAKDQLSRKKAQDLKNRGEQAARNYDNERPNQENVDQLAKKLGSKDERDRREAEQRIKDWEKDQQTREDLKKETDELKKKDRNAGENVENAMNRAEQARKPETPKVDEKNLADIAKNLNGMDEKAKADAKEKLEKMMRDPKTRQEAKDKLDQMANNATDPKEKQDLQDAAKQAGKMADEMARKDPQPKDGRLDPKALEDAAKKLDSGDPKDKEEAKRQLEQMAKDPKTAKEMQDKLKEMANNAKTPEDKQALENAAKEAAKMADELAKKDPPKINPEDLKDIAKKMAGNDPKAKEDAEKKLNEMMKDPKTREQAMKMMEDMAKNMKNTPEDQKAIEDAMKKAGEMAKNNQLDPKDLKDIAKEFEKMDPKAKEELRQKMEEALKDPKRREELKKAADELAKNATPEQKKQFDDMMRQLASAGAPFESKPDPADPKNKLKSAELTLEKFKRDRIGEELNWTDEQIAKWIKDQEAAIDALRKQVEKGDWTVNRNVRTPGSGGIVKPDLAPKDANDTLRGSRYAPPSGYVDPYKKFVTGGGGSKK